MRSGCCCRIVVAVVVGELSVPVAGNAGDDLELARRRDRRLEAVGALRRRIDAGLPFDHGHFAALRPVREEPLGDAHAVIALDIADIVNGHRNDRRR